MSSVHPSPLLAPSINLVGSFQCGLSLSLVPPLWTGLTCLDRYCYQCRSSKILTSSISDQEYPEKNLPHTSPIQRKGQTNISLKNWKLDFIQLKGIAFQFGFSSKVSPSVTCFTADHGRKRLRYDAFILYEKKINFQVNVTMREKITEKKTNISQTSRFNFTTNINRCTKQQQNKIWCLNITIIFQS
jgi:hypothetical protein